MYCALLGNSCTPDQICEQYEWKYISYFFSEVKLESPCSYGPYVKNYCLGMLSVSCIIFLAGV